MLEGLLSWLGMYTPEPAGPTCRGMGSGGGRLLRMLGKGPKSVLATLTCWLQGLEVPLIAVVRWSTPKLPFTTSIYTHYR